MRASTVAIVAFPVKADALGQVDIDIGARAGVFAGTRGPLGFGIGGRGGVSIRRKSEALIPSDSASAFSMAHLSSAKSSPSRGESYRLREAQNVRWRVVDWEQRGAGRSFRGDEDATVLTLDRLVLDGVELVEWICNELAVERVVLVGHSFGTVLGVLMSQKAPGRIGAYVGAAQVVQWAVQEELGYDWALAEARRQGKARAFEALERLGRPAHGMYAAGVRSVEVQRRWLGSLGGVSADPSFLLGYLRAMRRSMECLWSDLGGRIDLVRDATRLDVPVHLFAGRRDRITDLSLIELWYATVEAPQKRLDVVDLAGHLAPFEAPERFMACLETVRAFA